MFHPATHRLFHTSKQNFSQENRWQEESNPFSKVRIERKFQIPSDAASLISSGCEIILTTDPSSHIAQTIASIIDENFSDSNLALSAANFLSGYFFLNGIGCEKNEKLGLEMIQESAKNFAPAQVELGELYLNGSVVEKDTKKAFEFISRASELGNSKGIYWMGVCYKEGFGTEPDDKKSLEFFQAAAEKGDFLAMHALALRFLIGDEAAPKDEKKAIGLLSKAFRLGSAESGFTLGTCFVSGIGVTRDTEKAVSYFEQSAAMGNSSALVELGHMQISGVGTKINRQKGYEYFLKAAEQQNQCAIGLCHEYGLAGFAPDLKLAVKFYMEGYSKGEHLAAFRLGKCFENGFGVPLNHAHSFKLYSKLAKTRHYLVDHALGTCFLYGNGTKKDFKLALTLLKEAAKSGYLDAFCDLADCYIYGMGVTKDVNMGILMLEKAAENDHPDAQIILGSFYQLGNGVPKDSAKAFYYYNLAGNNGSPEGKYNVAFAYLFGFGTNKDEKKAVDMLRELSEKEFPLAMCCLGICYENGTNGVEKNENLAAELYAKSATMGYPVEEFLQLCELQGFKMESEYAKKLQERFDKSGNSENL